MEGLSSKEMDPVDVVDVLQMPMEVILFFCFPPQKLHIMVSSTGVKLNVDCQPAGEKEIKAAGNTSSDGYQVLGKMSKSGGSARESATVSPTQNHIKTQSVC